MTNDKTEFYFNALEDEEESRPHGYNIMMVRRSYNIGSTEYFEEYVYDEDCKPLFWFTRFGYYEGKNYSFKVELRGYFDADGTLVRTICKKAGENEELKTCSVSDRANEYDEMTFEDMFPIALKHFQLFKTAFDTLYSMDYSF